LGGPSGRKGSVQKLKIIKKTDFNSKVDDISKLVNSTQKIPMSKIKLGANSSQINTSNGGPMKAVGGFRVKDPSRDKRIKVVP